jgi:hypothetical protein
MPPKLKAAKRYVPLPDKLIPELREIKSDPEESFEWARELINGTAEKVARGGTPTPTPTL